MAKTSYGVLLFRQNSAQETMVLLAHPGGPIWGKRDKWSVPKGELEDGEDPLICAKREFTEETGAHVPDTKYIDLGEIKQSSAKINHIWAAEGVADTSRFTSNEFEMEWPPHSGRLQRYPENDRIEWFTLDEAKTKLFPMQVGFIERLEKALLP